MLFDRLVTGQVVPMNPAAAVPRLNHVVNTGKAPVLEAAKSTPAVILRDLRDRPSSPRSLISSDGSQR